MIRFNWAIIVCFLIANPAFTQPKDLIYYNQAALNDIGETIAKRISKGK